MANTTSPSPSKKRPITWRKVARRAAIALVAGLILLLVVFLLLPVWISNDQGRAYVLQRINHHLNQNAPGVSVTVDEWSLGWFRASDLKNLRILRADGTTLLSCPRVKSGLTLWDIWWGRYDLGNTSADNLELAIIKYPDGTTSLADLAAASDWLSTLRGGLQINDGKISITSAKSNQTERLSNVKATLTIADPEIPFHLQISAAGTSDLPRLAGDISINATLPALSSLAQPNTTVDLWALLADTEFSATNVPAALFCDYLSLDTAWGDSLGQSLEIVRFSNHASSPLDASRPALLVRGISLPTGPNTSQPEATQIDARLLLRAVPSAASPDHLHPGHRWIASLPAGSELFHVEVALRMSPAMTELLRHIHPMLGEIQAPAENTGIVHLSLSSADFLGAEASQATGRLTFPPFISIPARSGITAQLQSLLGSSAASMPDHPLNGSAGVLRFTLNNDHFTYDNFVITLGRANINFSGSVSLKGEVNLIARLPTDTGTSLSSSTMQVLIGGTIDAPTVRRAE